MTEQQLTDALESLIDSNSVAEIVACLSDVCSVKAEHLRSNWQDENAAQSWEYRARVLSKASLKL